MSIPITNSLVMSWIVVFCIVVIALIVRKRTSLIPGKSQRLAEMVIGGIHDFVAEALESTSLARCFTPLLAHNFSVHPHWKLGRIHSGCRKYSFSQRSR